MSGLSHCPQKKLRETGSKGLPVQNCPGSKGQHKETPDSSMITQKYHLEHANSAYNKKQYVENQFPRRPEPE